MTTSQAGAMKHGTHVRRTDSTIIGHEIAPGRIGELCPERQNHELKNMICQEYRYTF